MDSLISALKIEGDRYVRCNQTFIKRTNLEESIAVPRVDEVRYLCEQAGQVGGIVSATLGLVPFGKLVPDTCISNEAIQRFKSVLRSLVGLVTSESGGMHVDCERLVAFILANIKVIVVDGKLLIYDYAEGIYVDAQVLGRLIVPLLNYAGGDVWSHNVEQKVFELLLRRSREVDRKEMDCRYYIFETRALDLETLKLVPFSPSQLSTIKSHVTPRRMPTPYWDKFLGTTFSSDDDATFVREWLGYQLTRNSAGESFLFLYSTGAGGKSTLLNVMRSLVGVANTTSTRLQQLSGDFGLAPLMGKTSLLSDESSDETFPFEIVKSLTTGSPVTVNRKYKDAGEVVLPVKLTFALNTLPPAEHTLGFERRLLLLPFPHAFLRDKADKDLPKHLESEMPGIAFQAIQALKRLRNGGYKFTESDAMRAAKRDYLNASKPVVLKYLEQRVHQSKTNRVRQPDVYTDYQSWAQKNSQPQLTNRRFWIESKKYWQLAVKMDREPVKVQGIDYLDHLKLGDEEANGNNQS